MSVATHLATIRALALYQPTNTGEAGADNTSPPINDSRRSAEVSGLS